VRPAQRALAPPEQLVSMVRPVRTARPAQRELTEQPVLERPVQQERQEILAGLLVQLEPQEQRALTDHPVVRPEQQAFKARLVSELRARLVLEQQVRPEQPVQLAQMARRAQQV
jgi:hypothetical protein